MHLGVNLRKAQNAGIQAYEKSNSLDTSQDVEYEATQQDTSDQNTSSTQRDYVGVDTFVHAFCKLIGQVGTPEYGQGVSFRDFVTNELQKTTLTDRTMYLHNVLKTNLERQVGSRYFVTALTPFAYTSCTL